VPAKNEFVVIGRILRPQGRRGEVLADILTDFPEKFAERRQLWLAAENGSHLREYNLEEHWFHKGRVVFKFGGIDSISDAEALKGMLVQVTAESRVALDVNSFYVSDLIGNTIIEVGRKESPTVGIIEDVQQIPGSAPVLLVRNGKQQYEIPFAEEYLIRVDAARKILEMKLPQGLLEINGPLSRKEKKKQ
jgi:16S rRNA processing protein RimM